MKQIALHLDPRLVNGIDKLAAAAGKSRSAFMRDTIRAFVESGMEAVAELESAPEMPPMYRSMTGIEALRVRRMPSGDYIHCVVNWDGISVFESHDLGECIAYANAHGLNGTEPPATITPES